MKKLFLGALAVVAALGLASKAHALGTFGLFTHACCCNCNCNSYPQQNAFTPPCCGCLVVPSGGAACASGCVDGAGHFGLFGHCNKGCNPCPKKKCLWGHKSTGGTEAGCADCGGGYAMGEGGFAMGPGGYAMDEGGYPMSQDGSAMGQDGRIMDGSGIAVGQGGIPMGENGLGLGAGEELVGDVKVDGQVVSPSILGYPGRIMQPQAPALIPGNNLIPTPAQQYFPAPAARPMMPPTSMNLPYGASYPTVQQAGYTPNYAPPVQPNYNPYSAVPQFGYHPSYGQQQVPYYWTTPGGR
jgi:hypothetical protein